MYLRVIAVLAMLLVFVSGCKRANVSVTPVTATAFRVMVEASPRCGPTGAQRLAVDEAAVATVKSGFDRFEVVDLEEDSVPVGVTTFPTASASHPSGVTFNSPVFSGIARRHHLAILVLMFTHDEPGAETAIDARRHLGKDWQEKVEDGVVCT